MEVSDLPVVANPMFFLDYDGTLAPIVEDPSAAVPHPAVPELLRALNRKYSVWIVTGRYLQDLSAFIDEPYEAIGLHGMQRGRLGQDVEELIPDDARRALHTMRTHVPEVDGLRVESKGPTFAVHYRHVRREAEALDELEAWLQELPAMLDVIRGKKVYEIRPRGLTKGTAVHALVEAHPDATPIYLGDDVTDEDAFEALHALERPSVTIKVGEGETRAKYRVRDPEEVVAYLRQYVDS